MNPTNLNNANALNGNENSIGGRVRIHAEPSHVKAPPQTRMVSRFKKPQPVVQRHVQTQPTIGSTLPQHPNVQMNRLLNTSRSAHNPTLNRMLDTIAAKHIEAVQRAEAEDAQQAETQVGQQAENEQAAQAQPGIAPKVQRMEDEAPTVSKSQIPAGKEAEETISPQGEADTDVHARPEGAHRTRGDPNNSSKTTYIQKTGGDQTGTPALQSALNSSKGAGSPLPESERGFFESRMGADFSNVRVHTGSKAIQMNEGLGAQAFAHGSDFYFNTGKYQPGTSQGRHLMAHELTHTIQQGGVQKMESEDAQAIQPKAACSPCAARAPTGVQAKCNTCEAKQQVATSLQAYASVPQISRMKYAESEVQPSLKIGQPGDKYEQEADAVADSVMRMPDQAVRPSSTVSTNTHTEEVQRFSLSGAWNWTKGKVKQGVNWAKNTLGKVGDWATDKLAGMLEYMPGWKLLTVFLGKNPITGEKIARTDRNLVEGMVKLSPMGMLTFQTMDAHGGIDRAAKWLTDHRAKYLLTNPDILQLTDKALALAQDWKIGEAIGVIKIGLGRLMLLAGAALKKFAEIAIEKMLDFTIWLVEQISPASFFPLTPLVFVFKHGMIGFLQKLRSKGGANLLQMLVNIGKAITRPGFIWAYIKGIVKGFFVEGLWGTLTFFWEILKLPYTIAKFIVNLTKYLSSPEWMKKVQQITDSIHQTGDWLKQNGGALIEDLKKEAGNGGGVQLGGIFNSLISSAAGWVQKGGAKMADTMFNFFTQSPDKLGPVMGNTIGTVVGAVLFEVVLSAVTFGGGSAVTATRKVLQPIFKSLGAVGRKALTAVKTIGIKLRDWIAGAAKGIIGFLSKISKKIGSKVEELFKKLGKWGDELEGGVKKVDGVKKDRKLKELNTQERKIEFKKIDGENPVSINKNSEFYDDFSAEIKDQDHTYRYKRDGNGWCRFSDPECGIGKDELPELTKKAQGLLEQQLKKYRKRIDILQNGGKNSYVYVSSKAEADELLKLAFPKYQKVRGIGSQDALPLRRFKKIEAAKKPGTYHKDYSVNFETGRVRGHRLDDQHGAYPHINILRKDNKKVVIFIKAE